MGLIPKGLLYLKSLPGILKLVEFVVLVISMAPVAYFMNELGSDFDYLDKKGNIRFFIAMTVIACVVVVALFVLFLTGLQETVSRVNWALAVAIISIVLLAGLFTSSALLADTERHYKTNGLGEGLHICNALSKFSQKDSRCSQLIVGSVFGFIASAIFVADAVIHFRIYRTGGATAWEKSPIVG